MTQTLDLPKASLPANFEAERTRELAEITKQIQAPTGDRIRLNGNVGFNLPDGTESKTLNAVILGFVSANFFYDRPYVEGEITPPACYAIGLSPQGLVPSDNAPAKQQESCAPCPNNQFGSSSNGKGKACRNTRLVALTPPPSAENPAGESPVWVLSVPPTSLNAYDKYVANLANKARLMPYQVVTTISLDPDSKYALLQFRPHAQLEQDELAGVLARKEEAMRRLMTEPDVSSYEAPAPKQGRKR